MFFPGNVKSVLGLLGMQTKTWKNHEKPFVDVC